MSPEAYTAEAVQQAIAQERLRKPIRRIPSTSFRR